MPSIIRRAVCGTKAFQESSRVASVSTTATLCHSESTDDVSSCPGLASPVSDPSETLIFLDWDDTLFPTSELLDHWGVQAWNKEGFAEEELELSAEQTAMLKDLQESLQRFLSSAMSLSGHCVIVTNARSGWVEECIQRFVPGLARIFSQPGGLKVVYAREFLKGQRRKKKLLHEEHFLNPVRHANIYDSAEERQSRVYEELVTSKYQAMKHEADYFFKSRPNNKRRNIMNMGDMEYEYEAIVELGMTTTLLEGEELRIKSLLLPEAPRVSELTLRLEVIRLLLPAFVHADTDLSVNLKESDATPFEQFGQALQLPALADLQVPAHAWGQGARPTAEEVADSLIEIAAALRTEVQSNM